jgi:CHAT domain-containing protein
MKFIYNNLFIALIINISLYFIIGCERQPDLVELQKLCVTVETIQEKSEIATQVEEYYHNLTVNDSIVIVLQNQVNKLISDVGDLPEITDQVEWSGKNIYELELKLSPWIKDMMICRAKNDSVGFNQLMSRVRQMAAIIDSETKIRYWIPFVSKLRNISSNQSASWLLANEASVLCKQYHDQDRYWKEAEQFASLGLMMLRKKEDERLQLDILHRLQFIIDRYYGLQELSVTMAEVNNQRAHKMGYYLRAAGIQFRMAWTLHTKGEIARSYAVNQELISYTKKYNNVPFMSWYQTESSILLANEYWQLGEYNKGLAICRSFNTSDLNYDNWYRIANTEGLICRALGQYEQAEIQFYTALRYADSSGIISNKISILTNIGFLFDQLTEYDRSIEYFIKARDLLAESNPENYEYRADIILNLIDIRHKNGEDDAVKLLVKEAKKIINNLGDASGRKVDLLMALGQINLDLTQYKIALEYFRQAVLICDEKGMIHEGLQNKIRLAGCMIKMQEYAQAENELDQILAISEEISALERIIDAIALQAEIQYQKGNVDQAIQISNLLIKKIDQLSGRFENRNRLYAYRQKIYDYLKRSIIYEIDNNQLDMAYSKLVYAKRRSFKDIFYNKNTPDSTFYTAGNLSKRSKQGGNDISKLVIILDYLLTTDSLYVFLIEGDKVNLLRKRINWVELQKNVIAFKEHIHNTIKKLREYRKEEVEQHYLISTRLGSYLYEELIGSFELDEQLNRAHYLCILPDEFLFEIPYTALVVDTLDGATYLTEKVTIINNTQSAVYYQYEDDVSNINIRQKKVLISADSDIPGVKDLLTFLKTYFTHAFELVVQNGFSKENVLQALNKDYQIYIIVGHASANEKYPEQSAIEFTIKNIADNEIKKVPLTVADLQDIDWSGVEMILLVGCETGSGKIYRSAGIAGLQQSITALGAKNVLGTLWEIDAGQAVYHIKDFVQFWTESGDPAQALRKTQEKALKHLSAHKFYRVPHPYLWSGYILSNNYN